jgi:competence protein ComEC
MRSILGLLAILSLAPAAHAAKNLEIYFIDVEGGQSTLIIAPSGGTLLVDAGWPGYGGRDADRIAAVMKHAKVKKIDYALITHHHRDHVGGTFALTQRIPVGTFLDHGPTVEKTKDAVQMTEIYEKALASGSKHVVVKPGDTIPIKGLDVRIVESNGEHIASPLPGAGQPNPACAGVQRKETDASENARSAGIVLTFNSFRFADLGDLTWNKEIDLVCPINLIGTVNVYLTTHHGLDASNSPAIVHALHPKVAIMNNGAKKGGSPAAWQVVHSSPGLEDLWQLHFAVAGGKENNSPDTMIANLDENCEAKYLHLSVQPDGTYTVTNSRNKYEKTYH